MTAFFSQTAPLILAALGALWSESAGFLAISIDGWMVFGGFFAYTGAFWTGSTSIGALLAAFSAALLSYCAARLVLAAGSDSFIAGLALNLGISGGTALLSAQIFGTAGVLRLAVPAVPPIALGGTAFCAAFLCALVLRRTPFGLRLCATGFSVQAALERGIDVNRYKSLSWALAGFCAALAGAALTFRVGVYAPGGVAGRGWLAIAAVFLGFKRVRGIVAAALIFALAERCAFAAQHHTNIPAEALAGIPSLLALILYAAVQRWRRSRALRPPSSPKRNFLLF